jgi:hypothetical protein
MLIVVQPDVIIFFGLNQLSVEIDQKQIFLSLLCKILIDINKSVLKASFGFH